jgi:hypothetical protein
MDEIDTDVYTSIYTDIDRGMDSRDPCRLPHSRDPGPGPLAGRGRGGADGMSDSYVGALSTLQGMFIYLCIFICLPLYLFVCLPACLMCNVLICDRCQGSPALDGG